MCGTPDAGRSAEPVSVGEARRSASAAPPLIAFGSRERENFLASQRDAIIATVNRDGSPHATPTWYHWSDGAMRISCPESTQKVRNIERDPRISVCVDDQVSGTFITAFGRATVIRGDQVDELTWPLLLKYLHEDEARIRWARINADRDRVVIMFRPDRIVWRSGVR
jgi:PPOX class probable F420-dependent enzyme